MNSGGAPAPDDVVERYVAALATFGEAVRDVADHEWDLPTPASDWTVLQVVAHVVFGEAQLPATLAGELTHTQRSFSVELLGPQPLTSWRGTALRAIEAAREPGVAERRLDLDLGSTTGAILLGHRVTDNVVHAWDIAVAVGRPRPVDDGVAEWLLDFWLPIAGQLVGNEFYAAPVEPASSAAGDRLIALLGRTPPPR